MRADIYVAQQLNISRSRASDLIKRGFVVIGDSIANDCSKEVHDTPLVQVSEEKHVNKVSRGYDKLASGSGAFGVHFDGKVCLDIGSSTGGFTQYMLDNNAAAVVAVEVGTNQMHEKLRDDPRLILFEKTDIRTFETETRFDVVVCDVSFIPLSYILPSIDRLAKESANILLLFKPQFEVGKEINKKGVVTDTLAVEQSLEILKKNLPESALSLPCAITGGDGNQEYWIYYKHHTFISDVYMQAVSNDR